HPWPADLRPLEVALQLQHRADRLPAGSDRPGHAPDGSAMARRSEPGARGYRHDGGLVGPGLPHHVLPGGAGGDSEGVVRGCSGYFGPVTDFWLARPAVLVPRRTRPIRVGTVVRHATLVLFMLVILVPLAWVLLLSIKSIPDAYRPGFWPENFDFSHYAYVVANIPTLARNMLNSVVVTTSTVVLTTMCAVLGGYALVHLPLKGRAVVLALLV